MLKSLVGSETQHTSHSEKYSFLSFAISGRPQKTLKFKGVLVSPVLNLKMQLITQTKNFKNQKLWFDICTHNLLHMIFLYYRLKLRYILLGAPTYRLANFPQKLYENEENWTD